MEWVFQDLRWPGLCCPGMNLAGLAMVGSGRGLGCPWAGQQWNGIAVEMIYHKLRWP